jgi:hypothetical protein
VAEDSYPSSGRAAGVIIDADYEALASAYVPNGIVGTPAAAYPVYCVGDPNRGVRFRAASPVIYHGAIWKASADEILSCDPNPSSQARIDLACLEMDHDNDNQMRARIVTGTAGNSTGPTPGDDAIGGTGVTQYPLAWITVPPSAVTLAGTAVRKRACWLAEDGRTLTSTDSVRPAPDPGRLIFEYETGNLYLANGVSWRLISGDSGWQAVLTGTANGATGWLIPSNGYGGKIRNLNGTVTMNLEVQRNGSQLTGSTDTIVAKVPAGFEPPAGNGASGKMIQALVNGIVATGRVRTDGFVELKDYNTFINDGNNVLVFGSSWSV